MTPVRRWLLVLLGTALLVGVPLAWQARPADDSGLSTQALLERVRDSDNAAYSGFAVSRGSLALPVTKQFDQLGDLLGSRTRMRVWWRSGEDWRVDSIRPTGETDLVHTGGNTVEWSYESFHATIAPDPPIRLPRTSDVLPSRLGRRVLTDARPAELTRLGPRRVAGIEAAGLRLRPAEPQASIGRVDVWVDPDSGLPLRVDAYGRRARTAALTTSFRDLDVGTPPASVTEFRPPRGAETDYERVADVAAAANRFAPVTPPDELAGLQRRRDPALDAVGDYGRGATRLLAIPLPHRDAEVVRQQFSNSTAAVTTAAGTSIVVGPLGTLLDLNEPEQASWLLLGTVNRKALNQASRQLDADPEAVHPL